MFFNLVCDRWLPLTSGTLDTRGPISRRESVNLLSLVDGDYGSLFLANVLQVCMKVVVSGAISFLPPNFKLNKINLTSASSLFLTVSSH
jgi:hypothetical protein